jgi:hypothetical protein
MRVGGGDAADMLGDAAQPLRRRLDTAGTDGGSDEQAVAPNHRRRPSLTWDATSPNDIADGAPRNGQVRAVGEALASGGDGPEEIEARLDVAGVNGRACRVVQFESAAPVNNIRVTHFGRADDLDNVPLRLKPWDVRWIEVE